MGKKSTNDKEMEKNKKDIEQEEELHVLEMEDLQEEEQWQPEGQVFLSDEEREEQEFLSDGQFKDHSDDNLSGQKIAAQGMAVSGREKRNPFRVPLVLTGILLVLLVAGFVGGTLYLKLLEEQKKTQEVVASLELQEQERKAMEEAAKAQAEEEIKKRIAQAQMEGYAAGERDLLVHVQAQIESGSSIVEVLRLLYQDQIVVASGGKYHFIPRNNELKQNDYQKENLIVTDAGELQYYQNGAMTSYKGIDVSKFQGKIDWQRVAQDGVTFAFIRVGYRGYGENGKLMQDETATANLQGANDAGVKAGVYFYTQAITKEEAVEEAKMVLDVIAPYQIDCPVVIDVEKVSSSGGRMNLIDVQTRTEVVKTFCETVAAAGYRTMIYHNLEMGALMLDISQLEDYEKWFAYYNTDFYYPYAYQVWQYSDKGKVQGISGNVDMNVAFVPLWE